MCLWVQGRHQEVLWEGAGCAVGAAGVEGAAGAAGVVGAVGAETGDGA